MYLRAARVSISLPCSVCSVFCY